MSSPQDWIAENRPRGAVAGGQPARAPAGVAPRRPSSRLGRRPLGRRQREAITGYLLIALLIWLAATILWPLASSVHLSLLDVRLIGTQGDFIGLENYTRVLGSDRFWEAIGRSGLWILGNAVLQTVLAFSAALVLAQAFPGVRVARTWIILSWIVPTVVAVIFWRFLLNASGGGLLNPLLVDLGLTDQAIGFFSDGGRAFTTLVIINSWRWFPFITVILLAALLRVPTDLYEAAAIDGAGPFARFRYVTLPMLQSTLFVVGLIGTLLSFNVFDIIWLITAGGPSSATTTAPVMIYETAFKQFRLSMAAAMSVVTALLLVAFALVFVKLAQPKET